MPLKLVKLVRDRIPENWTGRVVCEPIRDPVLLVEMLRQKLREEVDEYIANPSIGEAADVYEVFGVLMALDLEVSREEVLDEVTRKRVERGSFLDGIGMYVEVKS